MLPPQALYWVLFALAWFALMFFVVPPKQVQKLLPFGFWMGLIQASIVLFLGQVLFKFWRIVGDPTLLGIPVLTAVSWVPPAIIFARFFSWPKTGIQKYAYVLLFAFGTAFTQYLQSLVGMWVNLRWNPFFTFLLALVTHSIMTGYLILNEKKTHTDGNNTKHRFVPTPARKYNGEIKRVKLRKPLKIK